MVKHTQQSHIQTHWTLFIIFLVISASLEIFVRFISPGLYGQDFFGVWPPIDNVMHFLWGLTFFLLFSRYMTRLQAIYCVFFWQMGWELIEMLGDQLVSQPAHMLDLFFFDGIKDTFVDLAGAVVGFFLLKESGVSRPKISVFGHYYAVLMSMYVVVGSILFYYFFQVVGFELLYTQQVLNVASILAIMLGCAMSLFFMSSWDYPRGV
jgi:hypothetical protein